MAKRITEPWLSRCPKCGGNLYPDSDEHGRFEHCLQCGYMAEFGIMAQNTGATRQSSMDENRNG